jgi:hypothetical protein
MERTFFRLIGLSGDSSRLSDMGAAHKGWDHYTIKTIDWQEENEKYPRPAEKPPRYSRFRVSTFFARRAFMNQPRLDGL